MDRKAWIVVSLCVAGLIAYYYYYGMAYKPVRKPVPAVAAAATATPAAPTPLQTPAGTPKPSTMEARNESLSAHGSADYIFSNDTGGIETAILLMHRGENRQSLALNGSRDMPIGAIGSTPGEAWGGFEMSTNRAANEATFHRRDPDGLEITKRFVVPDGSDPKGIYVVKMDVEFRNSGTAEVTRPNWFVSPGGAAPVHANDLPTYTRFDWMHDGKSSNIDVNWFNASTIPLIGIQTSGPKSLYNESKPEVTWAAVASQYFCSIVTSQGARGTGAWAERYESPSPDNHTVHGIEGGLILPGFQLAPGATTKETFVIYSGPKELARLRALGGGQDAVLNFGPPFGFISEFLLWAMNGLNGIFHSYAAAIIALTLIIKSGLWPIQNKATGEMRKMAALSPKMTEMREKYKDDPQKLNEEMMKLYRDYGVNPFSGCFPMLIQIPIFFGFYAMLGSAIELRNSSFLWVQDLSQPDTVGHVLGFPINVLPIVMAGTMVWQMVISPKSGDAMQQRMFYFMPVIFLVFCYNYASGLALYWTTQNIFSIVQLYLTRNRPLPTLEKKSVVAKREAENQRKQKKKRPGQ